MIYAIRNSLSYLSVKQRFSYFLLVSIRAFASLLDVLGIILIGLLTGIAASNLEKSKPVFILGVELPKVSSQTILLLVLIVLLVFILKAIISIWLGKSIASFLARIESEKSKEISTYIFSGDLTNLHRFTKGEIIWATMGSTTIAFSGLLTSLSTFISEGALLILVAITFFVIDPVASIFVFAYFLCIVIIIQFAIGNALKKAGIDSAEGSTESVTAIDDTINAFREIIIFNKEQHFISRFSRSRTKMATSLSAITFLSGMPRYVVETALMLGVVLFVGFQFATDQLSTGLITVGVFLTGGVRIMASLLPLQNAVAGVKIQTEQSKSAHDFLYKAKSSDSAQRFEEKADNNPNQTSSYVNTKMDVLMKDLSYRYPDSTLDAVKDINIKISSGQHVAFIGPSGAGKTTIVDIILGLLEPTSGLLKVGGIVENHRALIENGLVAYVPQRPGIVTGTIAENVALGVDRALIDPQKVKDALSSAHLLDFVNSLPEGIYSSVGSQAESLSGGQVQRLGLARALYFRPKLLVLDEATSALDASSEAFISESLRELGKDVTVIVIAHRLSTVQHADNVFVVDKGQIVASGTFSYLRKHVPMVSEYVKLMSFEENIEA